MNDLENLCFQTSVDRRYSRRLDEKLEEKGYLKICHYFKRVNGDKSEYLFLDGINDESRGTHYFNLDDHRANKFERLVYKSNSYQEIKDYAAVMAGVIGAGFAIVSGAAVPYSIGITLAAIGVGAVAALCTYGLNKFCWKEREHDAAEEIKDNYLKCREGDLQPYCYDVIKLGVDGVGEENEL